MKRIINKQTGMFLRDDFTFDEETEIGLEVNPAQGFYHPKWDGEQWIEGATAEEIEALSIETVPEKISKLQLKVQLVMMGYDLQLIEDAIKQLTEPQRTIAMLAWTDATNIHRDNSFITMVAQILQLTEKQVDQIFIEGDKIKL